MIGIAPAEFQNTKLKKTTLNDNIGLTVSDQSRVRTKTRSQGLMVAKGQKKEQPKAILPFIWSGKRGSNSRP